MLLRSFACDVIVFRAIRVDEIVKLMDNLADLLMLVCTRRAGIASIPRKVITLFIIALVIC